MDDGSRIIVVDVSEDKSLSAEENNLNIYRIDSNSNVLWRVNAPLSPFSFDLFVNIAWDGNIIRADRFKGEEFKIDPHTGVAKQIDWHK
jgi:hypothetical protein